MLLPRDSTVKVVTLAVQALVKVHSYILSFVDTLEGIIGIRNGPKLLQHTFYCWSWLPVVIILWAKVPGLLLPRQDNRRQWGKSSAPTSWWQAIDSISLWLGADPLFLLFILYVTEPAENLPLLLDLHRTKIHAANVIIFWLKFCEYQYYY